MAADPDTPETFADALSKPWAPPAQRAAARLHLRPAADTARSDLVLACLVAASSSAGIIGLLMVLLSLIPVEVA